MAMFPSWKKYVSIKENQKHFRNHINNANYLIILACKHNEVKLLEYILKSNDNIVSNQTVGTGETCHNAFYYAIRSGNVQLLDTLINKQPGNYFAGHFTELDGILSQAYEELKLKNVPLSEAMEIYVESEIINLRFFSDGSREDCNVESYLDNIRERIDLVLQNISLLKAEFANTTEVDQKFLFITKFIAQNIHILKRQWKSTYDQIPWEEMEFCLISFTSSHINHQEINLFYNLNLSMSKIINHLENFANKLQEQKDSIRDVDIGKIADLPKFKRQKIVADIINNNPEFKDLYGDYHQIRDIHSLEKINSYLKLALLADPEQREGQLIITRVLQVIGEYLKNTLESPKMSNTTSELLLLSLPKNTRDVIIDLRNSLSHAYSLVKRTEIEENTDINFFIGIKKDIAHIDKVITDILFNNKINILRILLKKIINCENKDAINEVASIFSTVKLNNIVKENINDMEDNQLEKLIKELKNNITDQTNYEKELFNKIDSIINLSKSKATNVRADYVTAFIFLMSLSSNWKDSRIDDNIIRGMKFFANKTLESMNCEIEYHDLKEIAQISMKIAQSARSRIQDGNLDRLICNIFYIVQAGTGDLKWIEGLREKFNERGSFIPVSKQKKTPNVTGEHYNIQLEQKLTELNNILKNNRLSDQLIESLLSYKRDKKLRAVVEMLVLDILSILGRSDKYLENNVLFIDDNTPLLIGKCLRNHLAHDNGLVDVLLSDPLLAVALNAIKLVSEDILKCKKKIGKFVTDDPFKLKAKYDQSLIKITNQEKFFATLDKGHLKDIKSYLKRGTDIQARNISLSTTLHIAAGGPSLEIIKYILDQKLDVNIKDINGQTPLHIAAAHGRNNIVDFFITEAGVYVDNQDDNGKTPLHIAAKNGHKDTVGILLLNNANTNIKDIPGFSPLHYAMKFNHIEVAKILLEKEENVDINEAMGGYTSLHIVAENGDLELVNFLIENGANVNARNDRGGIPLHTAALNGHLKVVKALILKGTDVNSRVIDGCTPLHYAIENGHGSVANILLKYGADVNASDKTYSNTPLHYAAKDGYGDIVEALLKRKANASIATIFGITPLHFAAQNGHLSIVSDLLNHGANICAKDKLYHTPLHYAAKSGHKNVAELLLRYGAEVNGKGIDNQTPLHLAALEGHNDIIELLIENKAQVNALDINCRTPLHAAAKNGSNASIDLLIKNKAEVDARTKSGLTPLYAAALGGHKDVIDSLINSKANVNTSDYSEFTPLHAAIIGGHEDIVTLLAKSKAKVNIEGVNGSTPLHLAVDAGYKEIVKILVVNGANVNANCSYQTPLCLAIKHNYTEIVEVLIENGASVNVESDNALSMAALLGYRDIVRVLLKNKANVNIKDHEDGTPLHCSAKSGHKEIVNTLIAAGANIDAMTINKTTPLYLAAQEGHQDVAGVLIANGANVNIASKFSAPIHVAAAFGHDYFVKVLLRNGAKVNVKDHKNRTPLELAVARGHINVVKILLENRIGDLNAKGNDDWTILHIASQKSKLEMIKFLVDEGCNIHAKNASDSKPIHIAAREGFKDTVKFFLSTGLSVNEYGKDNQSLLHYAAMKEHLDIVEYLITEGADVNAKDANGETPMHFAAHFDCKGVIEVLLKNSAIYNVFDKFNRRPIDIASNKDVIKLLSSTEQLFKAIKHNNCLEVENNISAGAIINANHVDIGAPLQYASWKGFDGVVNVLLQFKANPNVVSSKGFTPLHYAAKFSHLKIVQYLLFHGAVYNAVSDNGKTPLDITIDRNVNDLFKFISESFKKVIEGNIQVINDLNKIKDIAKVKAVMGARNRENKTLLVVAIQSNFSKIKQLKQVLQGDISAQIDTGLLLSTQGNYKRALDIFARALERRKEVLGLDNPATIDIQKYIAAVIYKQGNYQEALKMHEQIFLKQTEILGLNNKDTLSTRSAIALVLHRQAKNEAALKIFKEVHQNQKELLGPYHKDTLDTQFHMALVLNSMGSYEEALNINREVFKKRKETLGTRDLSTVIAQNNIAMVLASQGKHEESLKIYKEVYEQKKMILGINHADTLRTLHNIAGIYSIQKKFNDALKVFQEALYIQQQSLPLNHPDTLNTQYNIGNLFLNQGKWIGALKAYRECYDQIKIVYGESDPRTLDIKGKMELINTRFKAEGSDASQFLKYLQNDINIAASNGNTQTVIRLLSDGADPNDKDIDGRTSLHYAANNGHINIVKILLKYGANVTQVTNKGNSPLHTATCKGYKEIVEILLQHVPRSTLTEFVNSKTTSSGTASLHVAAKAGNLEIVLFLLKHGATYNIENKDGKMPINLSNDHKVSKFLKTLEELFRDIKHGNIAAISKLRAVQHDEFLAITNARNNQGNTLLQVAITNKHKHVAGKLLILMKELNQVQTSP